MAKDPDKTYKGKRRLLAPRTDVSKSTKRKEPDPKPADELSADVREAVKVGEEILRTIEDDVREDAKVNIAPAFFDGVVEKTKAITDSLVRYNRVTPGQANVLDGMLAGVKKWVHGGREDD